MRIRLPVRVRVLLPRLFVLVLVLAVDRVVVGVGCRVEFD